ncbi:hypothetical protein ACJJTC_014085 [Scirpophaga incertulas]
MKIYFTILFIITISRSIDGISNVKQFVQSKNITFSRRILGGEEAGDTRPYMVYLRPANSDTSQNWLCGGVIIHEHYILTSAACIEEVKQFYVVSGTHRWIPPTEKNDPCIVNGAKKAVWKCVPKNYFFDGDEFDNSRWMVKDIAVVKVEDDFNFKRRIKGCDFIPQKIAFNNVSDSQEKPGIVGSVAGWGSTDRFSDANSAIARVAANSPMLLEADIVIMGKKACKNKWEPQYHYIIDEEMICAKDNFDSDAMSALCADQVECKDIMEIDDEDTETGRRFVDGNLKVHTASHINEARKSNVVSGGFCERNMSTTSEICED